MDAHAIPVLIRNGDGLYVAQAGPDWKFTPDPGRARVFDFVTDEVPELMAAAQRARGEGWTVVRANPQAGHEACDRCGRRVLAFKAIFDGRSFLCAECASAHGS